MRAALEPFAAYGLLTLELESAGRENPDTKLVFTRLTYADFRAAVRESRIHEY